jgi:galactokinase
LRDATLEGVESAEFADETTRNRARHVVTELARTWATIDALKINDFKKVGKMLMQSHLSLQHDFEVSCPELDFLTSYCNSMEGVYGSRMMGGGFGGSAIVLLDKAVASAVANQVQTVYKRKFGLDASIFLTSPSDGVRCEIL